MTRPQRARWAALPTELRDRIAHDLGGPIKLIRNVKGGHTPLHAAIVTTGSASAFVKGTGPNDCAWMREQIEHEHLVNLHLPITVPAPRMTATIIDQGWHLLIFTAIDGTPGTPTWPGTQLDAALRAIAAATRAMTPAPVLNLPTIAADQGERFSAWTRIAESRELPRSLTALDRIQLPRLEAQWTEATEGATAIHGDLRHDNLMVTETGVQLVDWSNVTLAAPWVDTVSFLAGLHRPPPLIASLITAHPAVAAVPAAFVDAQLAALAGAAMERSLKPSTDLVDGPALRQRQQREAATALRVLRIRGALT